MMMMGCYPSTAIENGKNAIVPVSLLFLDVVVV